MGNRAISELNSKKEYIVKTREAIAQTQMDSNIEAQISAAQEPSSSALIKYPVAAPRRSLTQGDAKVVGNRVISEQSSKKEHIAKTSETTAQTQMDSNIVAQTSAALEPSSSAPIKYPVAAPRRSLDAEMVGNRVISEQSSKKEYIAKTSETIAQTQMDSNIVAQISAAQEPSSSAPIKYLVAAPRRSPTQGNAEVVSEQSSKKEDIAKTRETIAQTQMDSNIVAQIPGAQELSTLAPIKYPVAAPRRSLTRTEVVRNRVISEQSSKKDDILKTEECAAQTQIDSNIVAQPETSEAHELCTESPHTPLISTVVLRYSETSAERETQMELNIDFNKAKTTGTQELSTEDPYGLTSTAAAPPFHETNTQSETLMELNNNTAPTPGAKKPPPTTESPKTEMQLIPTVASLFGQTTAQNETHMKLNIVQNTAQTVNARKLSTANRHMPSTPATASRDSETTAQNETHKEFNLDTDTTQTPGDRKRPTEIPRKKMIHTVVFNDIKPVEQSETHMKLHIDDRPENLCAPENPVTSDRCGRPIPTAVPRFVETAAQNKTPKALNTDHKAPQISGPRKFPTESPREQLISAAAAGYEEAIEEVPQYDGQGRYRKCQLHTNYDIIFFCLMCEEQLCSKCFVAAHLQHDVKSLEEVASVFRSNIKEKLDKQIAHSVVWKKQIPQLEDLKTSFLISLDEEYQRIDKSVGDHVNSIHREEERLSEELQNAAATLHQPESAFTTTSTPRASTQSQINHQISEELSYMLSKPAVIHHDPQSLPKEVYRNAFSSACFEQVEENSYLPLWGETTTIGRFISTLQLYLSQEIHEFEKATSVAYAKNGSLLVGDHERNHVKIYQKRNGQYTLHKVLKVSKHVWSVGATAENMYLVSTEDGISMFSESGYFMSHFIGKEDAVWHLVVAKGNVFGSTLGKITKFDSSGTPVRSITTEKVPQSFTLIDENTIAVCYSNLLPGVDVINCQSQHESGAKIQRKINVNVPLSLCFDEKSNSLLVGSGRRSVTKREYFKLGSGVIDQYCIETGQLVGRLAKGLYSPCCMRITKDSSLAVADWKSVKLYSLTRTDEPYRGKADHPTESQFQENWV